MSLLVLLLLPALLVFACCHTSSRAFHFSEAEREGEIASLEELWKL